MISRVAVSRSIGELTYAGVQWYVHHLSALPVQAIESLAEVFLVVGTSKARTHQPFTVIAIIVVRNYQHSSLLGIGETLLSR